MSEKQPIITHIETAEWDHQINDFGKPISVQKLATDPDTGMFVEHNIYHAGTVTKMHYHHCAHGLYVIKGKLHTDKGVFGPGTFLWHPEGCIMEHGATEEEDCEVFFICSKPFNITYI